MEQSEQGTGSVGGQGHGKELMMLGYVNLGREFG